MTWNTADKSTNLTLSNGDLTGTATANGARVRSAATASAGKRLVAFQASVLNTSNVDAMVGIANPSLSMVEGSGYPGYSNDDAITVDTNAGGTRVFADSQGVSQDAVVDITQGAWVLVAYDFDDQLFWMRVGTNSWNPWTTANPTSGTGGIDMAPRFDHGVGGLPLMAGWPYGGTQPAFIIDLDGSAYPHTPPSGWLWWEETVGSTGTLAATESGADTAAAAGGALVSGALTATEAGTDAAAMVGAVSVSGALDGAEAGADAASAAGSVAIGAAMAAAEAGNDAAALSGVVVVSGTMAPAEAGADAATVSGAVSVSGDLAATEAGNDAMAATGSVEQQSGTMSANESGPDVLASTGSVAVSGALDAAETGADTAAFSGASPEAISGALSAQEIGNDTAAAVGLVLIQGGLAATETGADTFASEALPGPRRPTSAGSLRPPALSRGSRSDATQSGRRPASISTARR